MHLIKTVHCIVSPFFSGIGPSPQRLSRWKKNILEVKKNPAAAVFVINETELENESREARDFAAWVHRELGERAVILSLSFFPWEKIQPPTKLASELNRKGIKFAPHVKISAFGQHALGCVPINSRLLTKNLQRIFPNTVFSVTELTGQSRKGIGYIFHILDAARPDLKLSAHAEAADIEKRLRDGTLRIDALKDALRKAGTREEFMDLLFSQQRRQERPKIRRLKTGKVIPQNLHRR